MRHFTIFAMMLALVCVGCGDDTSPSNNGQDAALVDVGGDAGDDTSQDTSIEPDAGSEAQLEAGRKNDAHEDPFSFDTVLNCEGDAVAHVCNYNAASDTDRCIWTTYNAGTDAEPNERPACACDYTEADRLEAAPDCR